MFGLAICLIIVSTIEAAWILVRPVRAKVAQAKLDQQVKVMGEMAEKVMEFATATMNAQRDQTNSLMHQAHEFGKQATDVLHAIVNGWSPSGGTVLDAPTLARVANADLLPTTPDDLDDDWRDPSYDFFPSPEGARAVIEHVGSPEAFIDSMRSGS